MSFRSPQPSIPKLSRSTMTLIFTLTTRPWNTLPPARHTFGKNCALCHRQPISVQPPFLISSHLNLESYHVASSHLISYRVTLLSCNAVSCTPYSLTPFLAHPHRSSAHAPA